MKIVKQAVAAIMGVVVLSQWLYGQTYVPPAYNGGTPANGGVNAGSAPTTFAAPAPAPNLNEKVEVNPIATDSKSQVLVYIANEPNAVAGRRVAAWLSQDAEKKQLADWLRRDLEKFPALVDQEISDIKQHAPIGNGVAIFTNKLLRDGMFLRKSAGESQFKHVAFNSDSRLEILSQPLTDPEVFGSLAKNLTIEFPTDEHQFMVVSKSQGTEKYVMATVMGQLFNATSKKQAFEIIENNANKAKAVAAAQKPEGTLGDNFAGDTLGGKMLTTGLTKEGFFESLQTENTLGQLEIPLLFLESCRSQLDAQQMQQLKGENAGSVIGSLYTSDKTGLRFTTINYPQLFQQARQHGSLAEGFVKYLDGVQATQIPIPEK
jgi:hypothetical protein